MEDEMVRIRERLVKLETESGLSSMMLQAFERNALADRNALRDSLDALHRVVEERHNRQTGFLAGITFMAGIIGAVIALGFGKLLQLFGK